jgi:hypothetical protein
MYRDISSSWSPLLRKQNACRLSPITLHPFSPQQYLRNLPEKGRKEATWLATPFLFSYTLQIRSEDLLVDTLTRS